ncbi:MAG TPA: hypothetical protein VNS58_15580 [Puia sp.]|jgi:hypothetical protein|nr:hypothetical protein [Puia sp.]
MCNCGNKRQALNPSNKEVKLRYTGNGCLTIRSASGKQVYHFSTANRHLTIKGEDAHLVRKFRELVSEE